MRWCAGRVICRPIGNPIVSTKRMDSGGPKGDHPFMATSWAGQEMYNWMRNGATQLCTLRLSSSNNTIEKWLLMWIQTSQNVHIAKVTNYPPKDHPLQVAAVKVQREDNVRFDPPNSATRYPGKLVCHRAINTLPPRVSKLWASKQASLLEPCTRFSREHQRSQLLQLD